MEFSIPDPSLGNYYDDEYLRNLEKLVISEWSSEMSPEQPYRIRNFQEFTNYGSPRIDPITSLTFEELLKSV